MEKAIISDTGHPYCCGHVVDVNYVVIRAVHLPDLVEIMESFLSCNSDFEPCGGPFVCGSGIVQAMWRKPAEKGVQYWIDKEKNEEGHK